jgi:hypothetical protein
MVLPHHNLNDLLHRWYFDLFLRNYWLLRNSQSCVTLSVSGIVTKVISPLIRLILFIALLSTGNTRNAEGAPVLYRRNVTVELSEACSALWDCTPSRTHSHTWHSNAATEHRYPVISTFCSDYWRFLVRISNRGLFLSPNMCWSSTLK